MHSDPAAEKNVLYEPSAITLQRSGKDFLRNIEVPFTFICKLQTVPSAAAIVNPYIVNCLSFITIVFKVLKETSAIRVVNYVR